MHDSNPLQQTAKALVNIIEKEFIQQPNRINAPYGDRVIFSEDTPRRFKS